MIMMDPRHSHKPLQGLLDLPMDSTDLSIPRYFAQIFFTYYTDGFVTC